MPHARTTEGELDHPPTAHRIVTLIAVVFVTFLLFRYASLASMLAAVSLPVIAVLLEEPWPVVAFAAFAAVAVIILHRGNIARLRSGTENRFRFRRTAEPLA